MKPEIDQPGLALRVRRGTRTISAQHRQLDDFYLRLAAALDAEEVEAARSAFARFRDALEAHLELEDTLYFPALRGLRPGLTEDLARLEDEHATLREQLAELEHAVERGTCSVCVKLLERHAGDLADHEGREEGLLAAIGAQRIR